MVSSISIEDETRLNSAAAEFGSGVVNLGRDSSMFGMRNFTISAAFELNGLDNGRQIILNNHSEYRIEVIDDDLLIWINTVDGPKERFIFKNAIDSSGWHDVQIVLDDDNNTLEMFLDGAVIHSGVSEGYEIGEPSSWDVTAGGAAWGQELDGQIADIHILDEAVVIDQNQTIQERQEFLNEVEAGGASQTDPIVSEPDPVVTEPDPVVTEPDPVVTEPDPVVTEPDPVPQDEELMLSNAAESFGSGVVNLGRDATMFGMQSFTISAAFELNGLNNGRQIILNNHSEYRIEVINSNLLIWVNTDAGVKEKFTFKKLFEEAGWHDVQVVLDSNNNTLKMYLDGVVIHSTTSIGYSIGDPSFWDVTAGGADWGQELDGQIADIHILDEAIEFDENQSILDRQNLLNEIENNNVEQEDPIVSEPDPVVTEPDPVVSEPDPVVTEPDPVVTEPDPVVSEPDPVVTEPDPVVSEPDPVVTEPDPVVSEPDPVVTEPDPVVTEPDPDNNDNGTVIEIYTRAQLLDALSSNLDGVTLKLHEGEYGEVVINNMNSVNGFTISSADPQNPASFEQITVFSSSNITLDSLHLQPLGVPDGGIDKYLIRVEGSSDINIVGTEIEGNSQVDFDNFAGFFVRDSNDINFEGNTLHHLERGAVFDNIDNANVVGNEMHSNTMDGFGFVAVNNFVIEDNYLHSFYPADGVHPDYMQFWTTGATESSENIIIRDNMMIQSDGDWAQSIFMRDLDGSYPYKNILIENNIIYQEHYHGITIDYVEGVVIRDNTVISHTETTQDVGIRISNGNDVVIENNIATTIIVDETENAVVEGNIIANANGDGASVPYDTIFVNSLNRYSKEVNAFETQPDVFAGANVSQIEFKNSLFSGDGDDNLVSGDQFANNLYGFDGEDTLEGGDGADVINGGKMGDILSGGAGSDTFVYEHYSDSAAGTSEIDTILDFDASAGGDKISFESIAQSPISFIGNNEFSGVDLSSKSNEAWLELAAQNFGEGVVGLEKQESTLAADDLTISVTFELNSLTGGSQTLLWDDNIGLVVKDDDFYLVLRENNGTLDYIGLNSVFDESGWHDTQVIQDSANNSISVLMDGKSILTVPSDGYDSIGGGSTSFLAGGKETSGVLDGRIADVTIIEGKIGVDSTQDTFERTYELDQQDNFLDMEISSGITEARFDDNTKILSVDINGDQVSDIEVELIGVSLSDLNGDSFIS